MIFTVTLNPALDKTVVIPRFAAGQVNRISTVRVDAGGKGINVSKCLHSLGEATTAAAILAGNAGKELEKMLIEGGITPLVLWVEGQTRTNLKIIDPEQGQNTDINEPGPAVTAQQLETLKEMISQQMNPGDLVILSGSLPAGSDVYLYEKWTAYFKARGAIVLLDADGEALLHGLKAAPYMIKPNNDELARLKGTEKLDEAQMISVGRELLEAGVRDVVISLGGDGALFLSEAGVYRSEGLKVPVKSTVGAGDSMVAAMAYGLDRDFSREEQIALAMAMGAASVMQDGSQAPGCKAVYELAHKVVIKKYEE